MSLDFFSFRVWGLVSLGLLLQAQAGLAEGDETPSWDHIEMQVLSGVEKPRVHLTAFQGQYVLLNLWAVWSAPCRLEWAGLNELSPHIKEQLLVVGLLMDVRRFPVVRKELEEASIQGIQLLASDELTEALGAVRALPLKLLLDPAGHILMRWEGVVPKRELEADLLRLCR